MVMKKRAAESTEVGRQEEKKRRSMLGPRLVTASKFGQAVDSLAHRTQVIVYKGGVTRYDALKAKAVHVGCIIVHEDQEGRSFW